MGVETFDLVNDMMTIFELVEVKVKHICQNLKKVDSETIICSTFFAFRKLLSEVNCSKMILLASWICSHLLDLAFTAVGLTAYTFTPVGSLGMK